MKQIIISLIAVVGLSVHSVAAATIPGPDSAEPRSEGVVADQSQVSIEDVAEKVFARAASQFKLLDSNLMSAIRQNRPADGSEPYATTKETKMRFPRTFSPADGLVASDLMWWCSGFYPGSLWFVYEYTGDEDFKELALKYTLPLEPLRYRTNDHDVGFQVMSSFGQAFRLTGNSEYENVITEAAASLSTRFNPVVGCIKSWNNNRWSYPVIIDNMMNLELLFKGAELAGDSKLSEIAVTHAETTMKNHYRPDNSSCHLVDYDPEDGHVIRRQTVQGLADSSAWSRGQSWGLYGYTMVYRFTGDKKFLDHAVAVADNLIPRLPEDCIPYWDYDSDEIPDDLRDVSAASIMASALIELSGYIEDGSGSLDGEKGQNYLNVAETILRTLGSDEYLAEEGEIGGFLLKHSVGNKPGNSEVDVPLTYADYYFLEALLRYLSLSPAED